jgi:CBS domain-containing membrane protein
LPPVWYAMKKIKKRIRLARYGLYKETLINTQDHIWAFLGSFLGISLIGQLHSGTYSSQDHLFLIGSFGASSVLIYGTVNSPFSQPRNLVGGHLVSAFLGVTMASLFPDVEWLSSALAVSLSIVMMQVTKTLHPPGGATALIACIGSSRIKDLGYWYVLNPVLSGVMVLLLVALIFNNMAPGRRYPRNRNWYKVWDRKYR